jgi:phosphatidylinositol-3-phosphatase
MRILATVAILVVAMTVVGAPSNAATAPPDPCGLRSTTPATYAHVVVVMEENLSYKNAIGSAKAPYLNGLAGECALATNFHNETHGSQPNYMAATSGVTTATGAHSSAASIFQQVPTWQELEESMGKTCGGVNQAYKRGHDPAYWYTRIVTACRRNDVPMAASDAGARTLPTAAFTFITPNGCHDHHWEKGCSGARKLSVQAMDRWLSGTIQSIQATRAYRAGNTLVIVTFDEGQAGTPGENCATPRNKDPSCHVPTIAVAAGVKPVRDATFYTHYSMLRSVERSLGLHTLLGGAAAAPGMRRGMGF